MGLEDSLRYSDIIMTSTRLWNQLLIGLICTFLKGSVLEPLGANTEGSQFLEPDGTIAYLINLSFFVSSFHSVFVIFEKK